MSPRAIRAATGPSISSPSTSTLPDDRAQPTRERLEQLRAPGAHQPVEPDDLAGAHVKLTPSTDSRPGLRGSATLSSLHAQQLAPLSACSVGEQLVLAAADHVLDDPAEIDVVGVGLGDQPAVAQHDDPVGDLERLLEVVRDVDDRDAVGGQLAHDPEQHLDLGRAERGRRLVHDQHARVLRERTGDLDDLLLAEPQLADVVRGSIGSSRRSSSAVAVSRCDAVVDHDAAADLLAGHEQVVRDAQVREQAELLVDDHDAAVRRVARRAQR